MAKEVKISDALLPSDTEGVEPIRHPIEPPEYELFAQRLVSNVGMVKGYVLESYKEAGLDPLTHSMFKTWADVPAVVKGRVKHLQSLTASKTVADKREIEEFLTAVMRNDKRIKERSDYRRLFPMDAVKELCKMRGYYSPVEIKNTHEIVVPDAIRRMSDEELQALANQAMQETIDVESEIKELPQ